MQKNNKKYLDKNNDLRYDKDRVKLVCLIKKIKKYDRKHIFCLGVCRMSGVHHFGLVPFRVRAVIQINVFASVANNNNGNCGPLCVDWHKGFDCNRGSSRPWLLK